MAAVDFERDICAVVIHRVERVAGGNIRVGLPVAGATAGWRVLVILYATQLANLVEPLLFSVYAWRFNVSGLPPLGQPTEQLSNGNACCSGG